MIYMGIPKSWDSRFDKVMSKCITVGKMSRKGGVVGISLRWCLPGLIWYWGLLLYETASALLSSHFHSEWRTRAVFHVIYLACRG